jgi:REP element-mobilizing transposase RayT
LAAGRDVTQFERRRRRLPHLEEPGATYFVTFRLACAGTANLSRPELGPVVVAALRHHDGLRYWLYDYTVMPDHVHLILKPLVREGAVEPLWRILKNLKSWTSRRINEVLGRQGKLWQDESYDHLIRNPTDYASCADYILQNAKMAGLVGEPTEWPWWG